MREVDTFCVVPHLCHPLINVNSGLRKKVYKGTSTQAARKIWRDFKKLEVVCLQTKKNSKGKGKGRREERGEGGSEKGDEDEEEGEIGRGRRGRGRTKEHLIYVDLRGWDVRRRWAINKGARDNSGQRKAQRRRKRR